MSCEVDNTNAAFKGILSRDDSAIVVACLDRWLKADKGTSTYEAALFVGLSRATLGRWLKGGVRIPRRSALRLLEGLLEFEKGDVGGERALADLAALLQKPPTSYDRLATAFRANNVRLSKTMAAIAAAGFRVVPIDTDDSDSHKTS